MENPKETYNPLKSLREQKLLSQQDFADLLKIKQRTYAYWEKDWEILSSKLKQKALNVVHKYEEECKPKVERAKEIEIVTAKLEEAEKLFSILSRDCGSTLKEAVDILKTVKKNDIITGERRSIQRHIILPSGQL